MEFTDEQEELIKSFQEDVQGLVVRHARNRRDAILVVDAPEFYGELCEMVAEFAANHAVDILYPFRETGPDGSERIAGTCECTDPSERKRWEKWLTRAKEENNGRTN